MNSGSFFSCPGGCQNQACFTGIPGMARAEYPGKNSTIWHGFSLLLYHRSQSACSGPVHPENPWRVGSANFAKLVHKALEYAGGPSRQEMAAALLTRGYTTSDMDAYAAVTPQQVETPPAPVIHLPAAPPPPPPATVRHVTVTMPRIQPTIPPPPRPPAVVQPLTPIPALPERPAAIQAPAMEPASDTKWMWALLIAGILVRRQAA